jgi:transcription elongation factor GreB
MSKAFTKDDDAWEEPVVAPRAPLPAGVPNYVTARGLRLLRDELAGLEAERQSLDDERTDEQERRRRRAIVTRRLADLVARVSSAQVVDPRLQRDDRVRFGVRVRLRTVTDEVAGEERCLEIVGVDEADPAGGRVAFTSPIARAVLGTQVGEVVSVQTPRGEDQVEVVSIDYPVD